MKNIVLCGSMKVKDKILSTKEELENSRTRENFRK